MPEESSSELPKLTTSELDSPLRSDEAVDSDTLQLQIERQMKDESQQILSDNLDFVTVQEMLQQARKDTFVVPEQDLRLDSISPAHAQRLQARRDRWTLQEDMPLQSSPVKRDYNPQSSVISSIVSQAESLTANTPEVSQFSPENTACQSRPRQLGPEALSSLPEHGTWLNSVLDLASLEEEEDPLGDTDLDQEIMGLTSTATQDTEDLIENETIRQPEGHLKVAVPELTRILVGPPWRQDKLDFLCHCLSYVKLTPDTTEDQQRQREMQWSPFPACLMQPGIEDSIIDTGNLSKMLELPKKITRSNQMLYRRPRLFLQDTEDNSDEEIEVDYELTRTVSEMMAPVKVVEAAGELEPDPSVSIPAKRPFVEDNWLGKMGSLASTSLSSFSACSPRNALDSFLDLRGSKFRKVNPVKRTRLNELKEDPIQLTQSEVDFAFDDQVDKMPVKLEIKARVQVASTPIPSAANMDIKTERSPPSLRWHRSVVIETALLQQYLDLVKYLERMGGNQLIIIYRDMAVRQRQGSPLYTPDMILSPDICLMFTTAQALSQKSLPGQGDGHNISHGRISALTQEYDRVLVLISCSSLDFAGHQAQKRAMVSFEQVCADIAVASRSVVNPIWADPDSAVEDFDSWTWVLICQYAYPATNFDRTSRSQARMRLSDEQSSEETLLATLGVNPMAAQVALLVCQTSHFARENKSGERAGLNRLLQMHIGEINEMLGEALSPRTLERLNVALETLRG
jgi:hypothetical protein